MPDSAVPPDVAPSAAVCARDLVRATARRLTDRVLGSGRAGGRRGRASWLAAVAAGALAAPWVVRQAVGTLDGIGRTAAGEAVTAAFDQAAADQLAHHGVGRVLGSAGAPGRHLGFDTFTFPGETALRRWKESGAPYEWVGYYLPAPCHRDTSWSGRRETVERLGFGTAVIYVGQQTWGRTPRPANAAALRAARAGRACNADFVHGGRGAVEGNDAVARTAAEGFPRGTVVFLDLERMERMPELMRAYYRAWARRLLADGRYRPGVYVHAHNAAVVHGDLVAEYAAAGVASAPPVWVASGRGFTTDKAPTDVGHAFAGVWQGVLDVVVDHGGVRLPIDVNVAAVRDPSAPSMQSVGE